MMTESEEVSSMKRMTVNTAKTRREAERKGPFIHCW